ncbi:unnamed protein product [Fraxinus pennsylvanica]|uniref:Zinc-ribbon domain-containing protein n=1 Tax=Fraxinus pennsylvanica TaxID=56036 RepID=A0AAD2E0Y9_9LAMI|nr:unnamed protein product [Fraxinus pennsylvanica]
MKKSCQYLVLSCSLYVYIEIKQWNCSNCLLLFANKDFDCLSNSVVSLQSNNKVRMTTQISTKFRLVICPRCRQLLTELPELPLYKCGGCGTTLKSKTQRNDTNHDGVDLQDTNRVSESEPDRILKENAESSSNLDLTPLGGKSLRIEEKPRDEGESVVNNGEKCEDTIVSRELSSSLEVSGYENKDLSKVVIGQLKPHKEGKCPLGQNAKTLESEFQDCNGETIAGRNSSAELPSSSECSSHDADVSNPEIREHMESDDKSPLEQCSGRDQKEYGDFRTQRCGSDNYVDQAGSSPEHDHHQNWLPPDGEHSEGEESTPLAPKNNEKDLNGFMDYNGEQCEDRSFVDELSSICEFSGCKNKVLSVKVIEHLKQDEEGKCSFGQNAKKCENGIEDWNGERFAGRDPSAEFPSSSEFTGLEANVSTPEIREHVESDDKNPSEHCSESDQKEYGDSQIDWCRSDNSLDQAGTSPEHDHQKNRLPPDGEHSEGEENRSCSDELSNVCEVSDCENKVLSAEVIEQLKEDEEGQCPFSQNDKRCESGIQDWNGENVAGRNPSAEFPSSSEFSSQEAEVLIPEIRERVESDDKNPSEQCSGRDQKEYEDFLTEYCGSDNSLDQASSSPEHDHHQNRLPPDGEHSEGEVEGEESTHLSLENNEKSLNGFMDYNGEQCEDRSFSDDLSSVCEVSGFENKVLSAEVIEQLKQDGGKCHFGQNAKRCESGIQDSNEERVACRNPSAEFPSSSEFTSQEANVSTQVVRKRVDLGEKNLSERCTGRDQRECGDSRTESCADDNLIAKVQSLPEYDHQKSKFPPDDREHKEGDESTYLSPENNEKGLNRFRGPNGGLLEEMDNNRQDSTSFEIALRANANSSLSAGSSTEVKIDIKNLPHFRSSSTERYENADSGDSLVAAQDPSDENKTSVSRLSPNTEQLDHSHREDTRSLGRVSSVDTLDSLPSINSCSKHSVKHVDMSKFPTTKSYYAYDTSLSSYDGTIDQIPNHVLHPHRRKFKEKISTSTAELHKKGGLNTTNTRNSESEMQYWAASYSSVLQGKQYHAMEGSNSWHHVELPETRRHCRKSGNRLAFTSRDFQAAHRNGSPSSYQRSLLQNRQAYYSSDTPTYSETDKMDLLRTVCELKEQLNRMQYSKLTANGRFPAGIVEEKSTPLYYDHSAPEREMYADFSHPTYPARHDLLKGWPQRRKDLRMAFSGEAAHYRHQVNCSCLHCCPQDMHRSAQLPSHSMLCNNGHCMVHTGHNCCNVLASSSSSRQHYTSSEQSLLGCKTMSGNQKHKDKEMKRLYLREKYHITKWHLLPIVGGTPLISCYHCSELLQLPSEFLRFGKKYHQLRCDACGKVLKFSLLERMHIVPYLPEASAPPPSEADDYSDAINQRNQLPTCSTEGDASFLTPSADCIEWNAYNRKMSSGSSYKPTEDRKMKSVLKGNGNKNESLVETSKPVGASWLSGKKFHLKLKSCQNHQIFHFIGSQNNDPCKLHIQLSGAGAHVPETTNMQVEVLTGLWRP